MSRDHAHARVVRQEEITNGGIFYLLPIIRPAAIIHTLFLGNTLPKSLQSSKAICIPHAPLGRRIRSFYHVIERFLVKMLLFLVFPRDFSSSNAPKLHKTEVQNNSTTFHQSTCLTPGKYTWIRGRHARTLQKANPFHPICSRKSATDSMSESVKPDSQKSYTEMAQEKVTDATDSISKVAQPGTS